MPVDVGSALLAILILNISLQAKLQVLVGLHSVKAKPGFPQRALRDNGHERAVPTI
jgi:hypothetical protein